MPHAEFPSFRVFAVLFAALFLGAADAWAACPVNLIVGQRNADGLLPVTVSTEGDCGGSWIAVDVNNVQAGVKNCNNGAVAGGITPKCEATFQIDTSCWPTGSRTISARSYCHFKDSNNACVRHEGVHAGQAASVNNTPTATLSMTNVDASWKTTATIQAHFPTRATGSQYIRLVRDGNINATVAQKFFDDGEQDVTWTFPVDLTCTKGPARFQAIAMTCGADSSVIGGNPVPSNPTHIGRSAEKVLTIDATPTATLTIGSPAATGATTATVSGHFPYKVPGRRYVRLFRNGNINSVVAEQRPADDQHDITFTVPLDFHCTSGTTQYQVAAMICGAHSSVIGGNHVPTDPAFIGYSQVVTKSDESKPDVSVSYTTDGSGADVAQIAYSYPTTTSAQQRRLEIYVDGVRTSTLQMTQQSGTHTFSLGTCWKTLRAVATACGKTGIAAFMDEDQTQAPGPKEPTVSVSLKKGPKQGNKKLIQGVIEYDAKKAGVNVLTVKRLKWVNAKWETYLEETIEITSPTEISGTRTFEFLPPDDSQQVQVQVILQAACGTATDEAFIACGGCDEGASSKDPVYYSDGNMRLSDVDPLPSVGPLTLTRTYNSDEQVGGLFGRGWTTVFDQRLIGSGSLRSVVTATNEIVAFRQSNGVLTQTWPKSDATNASLTYNSVTATYDYRGSGSREVLTFRAADGRLVAIRTLGTNQEALLAYDTAGALQTVTDTVSGVAWNLTVTQQRVNAIAISGRPDLEWMYQYDTGENLVSVQGPASSTWRTYEYANDRMTASRDALGNLIESHTYDADGYAVSSTGPGDEIASVVYNIPAAVPGDTITRVTYKTGAISEHTLRLIGGALRPVRVSGGCASCGAGDATYARDSLGRVIREQGAGGYIIRTTYDAAGRVLATEQALKPTGCDPATDAQHCRLETDALASATFASTNATFVTAYEYMDPSWPDRVTAVTRPSVHAPGQVHRESYTFHPVTGAITSTTVSGWTGQTPAQAQRTTQITFYGDVDLTPAFTPGGSFDPAWLSLPQPYGLRRTIDGPRTDVQDVTSFVYYPIDAAVPALRRGRLAATKDASGLVTHYEAYDVFGNVARIVDANGVATEMAPDLLGRPSTSTIKGVSGCDTSLDPLCATDLTTTRTYASVVGPVQTERRPGGGVTSYSYDARGRVHTVSRGPSATDLRERIEYTYDPLTGKKNLERTLAWESGSWVEKRRDSFAYDAEARLQTVTHPDATTVTYTYDADDRVKTIKDERHTTANTIYAYDPAGRLASVKQLLNAAANSWITTSYGYDLAGNLTSVTDPVNNATTYVYDDFGAMLKQTSPVSGVTTYAYDDAGNLSSSTDARGATTTRTYDAANRSLTAISMIDTASETVTYSYGDANAPQFARGRLTSMGSQAGTTSYSYERRGLLREELPFDGTFTQRYSYDADGNRTSIRYPSGGVVSYSVDYAGRQLTATGVLNGVQTQFVTSASYLPFGPATSVALGNGTTETRGYDNRYRPSVLRLMKGAVTVADYSYTSDGAGNITAIQDLTNAGYSRTFGYDDLNRLVTANTGWSLWGSGSYTYDAAGNVLSVRLGHQVSRAFNYSPARLITSVPAGKGQTNAISYDPAGNEIATTNQSSDGQETESRFYSPRNLLVSVSRVVETCFSGECTLHIEQDRFITHDGRGVRVLEEHWSTARFFYTPELNALNIASSSSGREADVVWFNGAPIGEQSPQGPRYTFTDHLGTPLLQTNTTGTVSWRAEYEPYGTVYAMRTGDPLDQPLRFPGQQVAFTGVNGEESYNIHRWYRSGWGRYTQVDALAPGGRGHFERGRMLRFTTPGGAARDRFIRQNSDVSNPALLGRGQQPSPMGLSDATNPYAYAANSPLMYTDPLGLAPCLTFSINPKADYVPAGPPGKMFKGCQYIGECYGSIVVYEDSDVTVGCKCKQFCLMNIEPVSSIPVGPSLCFDMPPWWAWSPPLIK